MSHRTPLSMGFSRQEYWSGLPCPLSVDLTNPGIKSTSPALAGGFFTTEPPGKSILQPKFYVTKSDIWRRKWQPIPVFFPGKCNELRSPAGYSLRDCEDLDTTEHACVHARTHTHTNTPTDKTMLTLTECDDSFNLFYFL